MEFEFLFDVAVVEQFAGSEYTFINYNDDEFYFYYDAEKETFEGQGAYELTDDQLNEIANAVEERYQDDLKEKREMENAPFSVDHYEMYGVSESMFI
ncbi:MAG: hypothetical protein ABGW97_03065 [Christiangramia sp.]